MSRIKNTLQPIIDSRTEMIILGSMPSVISLAKQRYYGNERNHFWKLMAAVFDVELPSDYDAKLALIKNERIGLWDTIETCERHGSLDSAIKKEVPNNFQILFKKYPNIRRVLFNGGKAEAVFKKHNELSQWPNVEFIKMPSTSAVPGRNVKSYEEKVVIWGQALKRGSSK